jgi:hypothetical protein
MIYRFATTDGFSSSTSTSGELSLFSLSRIKFLHGWTVDPQDEETWSVLVEKCGDYDSAVERVAEGDEISKGLVVGGDEFEGEGGAERVEEAVKGKKEWTKVEEEKVRDGESLNFLLYSSTSDQTSNPLKKSNDHPTLFNHNLNSTDLFRFTITSYFS